MDRSYDHPAPLGDEMVDPIGERLRESSFRSHEGDGDLGPIVEVLKVRFRRRDVELVAEAIQKGTNQGPLLFERAASGNPELPGQDRDRGQVPSEGAGEITPFRLRRPIP